MLKTMLVLLLVLLMGCTTTGTTNNTTGTPTTAPTITPTPTPIPTPIPKSPIPLNITKQDNHSIKFRTGYQVCEDRGFVWDCLTDTETTCTLDGINAPKKIPSKITVVCSNFDSNDIEEFTGVIP